MDIDKVRELFPVTKSYIYMNHAAVSPLPAPVRGAMERHLADVCEHGMARCKEWEEAVEQGRALAARLLGCGPDEIAFLKNTSEGIATVAGGLDWQPGDNVVLPAVEFPANVYPWLNLTGQGVEVRFVPQVEGRIRCRDILQAIDNGTRVVSISFVQFLSGFRADLKAIGRECRRRGVLLCVDAIQGLGALALDVRDMQIDFLAADGHKWLLGPEGAAIFFCSRQAMPKLRPSELGWLSVENQWNLLEYKLELRRDARRFECGTLNIAGIRGLAAAMEFLLDVGIERIESRVLELTDLLCAGLERKGYRLLSPRGPNEKSGIVSFYPKSGGAFELYRRLTAERIVVSPREGLLRVSPHFYNTQEEIERLLSKL